MPEARLSAQDRSYPVLRWGTRWRHLAPLKATALPSVGCQCRRGRESVKRQGVPARVACDRYRSTPNSATGGSDGSNGYDARQTDRGR